MQLTRKTQGILALAVSLSLASGACSSPGKRTAIGAGAGGAVGAGVGAAIGGKKGALIGAGVGAAAGGAYGNYLDKRARELEQVAETRKTAEGLLVKLQSDLVFDFNKANVKGDAQQQLSQLGGILAKYPDDKILIRGHTDSIGSDAYNQRLSTERAESVERVLVGQGLDESRLRVEGVGEKAPVASNASEAGRARNRRVELVITVPKEEAKRAASGREEGQG